MSLLDSIRTHARAAQAVASKALPRSTGWEVPGGQSIGASLGAKIKGGAGYANLPVRRSGSAAGYLLHGPYMEGGVGIGADVDAALVGKVLSRFITVLGSFGGSTSNMPSGSIGPMWFGPKCTQAALSRADFVNSSWLYSHVGVTAGVATGDAGVLMLMDGRAALESVLKPGTVMGSKEAAMLQAVWNGCKAWCFYAGTGLSLGAAVGATGRGIQMVKLEDVSF
jgi:hypothetical protein